MKTDQAVDLARWCETRRRAIDTVFETRLPAPAPGDDPGRLIEAMRYSLLAPGKRLRPLVALGAADAVVAAATKSPGAALDGLPDETVLIAAAAVELVHCYSLIHDDLPAMDDDDFRRGKPSNHKVFGEATAILAGDGLLTLAFEWLAEAGERSGRPADFGRAALALARGAGAGVGGMVRGQARDLGEAPPADLTQLERLHTEKTAALFRAAAEVGAAASGATPTAIESVGIFGLRFGVAFQHADDQDDGDHPSHAYRVRQRVPILLAEAVTALDGLSFGATTSMSGGGHGAVLRALAAQLTVRAETPTAPPPSGR